ncbi:MAG: hypothetical protein IV090_09400 [Candidatus Sericytochromatia bacterium]|nr:hypothetical protein [Candidatus Sericytochromatia bacterium]
MKKLILLSFLALSLAGCDTRQNVVVNTPSTGTQESKVNRKPIVQQMNANPTNVSRKEDIISFKVVAVDEDGDILKYVWSATKGTLSSTQGEIITWMPQKSDGSLETGVAIISVLVSDNKGGTDTSSVNVTIDSSGSAKVEGK